MDSTEPPSKRRQLWSNASEPTILICDTRDIVLDLYRMWLADGYTVRAAKTEREAISNLDHSVATVILGANLPDDEVENVRDVIWDRYPHCQTIIVTERSTAFAEATMEADAHLKEPLNREKFRECVEENVLRGMYGAALREYLHLSAYMASCEASSTENELGDDEMYLRLEERIAAVRSRLTEIIAQLDTHDFDALFESFNVRREYSTRVKIDDSTDETNTHHPPKCPKCGIVWDVDHGGVIGHGYTPLGAFIFRCTNCNSITKDSGPNHRRVARW